MADPVQENLLREIQEDLRREKLETLWKRYGSWLIAAAIAIVVAVGAFQAWRAWETSRRKDRGAEFIAAETLAQSDPAAATTAFATLAAKGSDGYALLAGFREAALLADQGHRDQAAVAYDRIAAGGGEPLYRDLATLRAVALRLNDGASGDELETLAVRLSPLSEDSNPWRYSAREMAAAIALQRGDVTGAREQLTKLQGDIETPQAIRARAAEVLGRLGPASDAAPDAATSGEDASHLPEGK